MYFWQPTLMERFQNNMTKLQGLFFIFFHPRPPQGKRMISL